VGAILKIGNMFFLSMDREAVAHGDGGGNEDDCYLEFI
jgi:hypothetical protein